MFVNLFINSKKTTEILTKFIKETVKKTNFSRLVVGLSGGVDSAVSCALAVRAIEAENVFPGLFPYGKLNREGLEDAKTLVKKLGIPKSNTNIIDIKPLVDPIFKTDSSITDIRKGNIMARMRMLLLYDYAKRKEALVLGTENKTEYLLGYFTRFGDEASDIEPLLGLYKTQVRQLASFLEVPEKIIIEAPSAGFWKGQTDEKELGFTYEDADKFLHLYLERRKSISEMTREGFDKDVIEKVINRHELNKFKKILPYATIRRY